MRLLAAGLLAGIHVLGTAAAAAVPPSPAPASPALPAPEEAAPGSPRAAVAEFLDLAREGRYREAARFLDLSDVEEGRGAELARRLKAVLDRHLWIDLDLLSPRPEGDQSDGLSPGAEQVGTIRFGNRSEPVRLVRGTGDEAPWVFSRGTVARIDAWYDALPDRWVRDWLPSALLLPGPRELLRWQWIALGVLVPLVAAAGWALGWVARRVSMGVASRTRTAWDEAVVRQIAGPLTAAWTLLLFYLLVPSLRLYAPAEDFVGRVLRAAGALVFFWALWRSVDVAAEVLRHSRLGLTSAYARSLIFIGARLAKAVVAAMGAVTGLSVLGYPVAGLLAGLGIGGLAMALAAQKTVENLFGSVALAVDQPFRVGDFVKVEDFVGTVEEVGLRSTRFRTLDRTLISIPNGRVADMRLESFTARDKMRLACTIGVVYGTTAAQMREVLAGLEGALRAHPKIWPDAVVVRFKEFAASSLDIEVMAWFETPNWSEFQLIRQEVLIQFMDVVERAGTSFAFPTRTVHLVGTAAADTQEARAESASAATPANRSG
ncbi:MAG TPA: mechanosensitive ion channel family protein [Vicinamibacteria bacterium]|nr:mechanosensitive ion channel family protein [Vicinamibacteria bacterium]